MKQALGYMQYERHKRVAGFSWGPLGNLPFLPRIYWGPVILSLAQWQLSIKDVTALIDETDQLKQFQMLQGIRARMSVPRWISFAEEGADLPVDLDNALSVDGFIHVLKRGFSRTIKELYPQQDGLLLQGPEGSYHHEVIVPYHRTALDPAELNRRVSTKDLSENPSSQASWLSDVTSEWFYIKIYGGRSSLEECLLNIVSAFAIEVFCAGLSKQWFFVRYSDPEPHLRVRFRIEEAGAAVELFRVMRDRLEPYLSNGLGWRLETSTYQLEVERYGGRIGLAEAHEIFAADSSAVLEVIRALEENYDGDQRWQACLLGVDRLLANFIVELDERRAFLTWKRDAMPAPFANRHSMATTFKSLKGVVHSLLGSHYSSGVMFVQIKDIFDVRSRLCNEISSKYTGGVRSSSGVPKFERVASYLHMHVNRILNYAPFWYEPVIYDLLWRHYHRKSSRL